MREFLIGVVVIIVLIYACSGSKTDYNAASEKTLQKWCADKDFGACKNLGDMYYYGKGAKINYERSAWSYEQACNADIKDACLALAEHYEKGLGVKQDATKAQELRYNQSGEKVADDYLGLFLFLAGLALVFVLFLAWKLYVYFTKRRLKKLDSKTLETSHKAQHMLLKAILSKYKKKNISNIKITAHKFGVIDTHTMKVRRSLRSEQRNGSKPRAMPETTSDAYKSVAFIQPEDMPKRQENNEHLLKDSCEVTPCPPKKRCGSCRNGVCSGCSGVGETKCQRCNTRGFINCTSCGARGFNNCSNCGGRGFVNKQVTRNGMKFMESQKCYSCDGKGHKKCSRCDGKGQIRCDGCYGSGLNKCSKCNGSGLNKCSKCNGSGRCQRCRGTAMVTCPICEGKGRYIDYKYMLDIYSTNVTKEPVKNKDMPKNLEILQMRSHYDDAPLKITKQIENSKIKDGEVVKVAEKGRECVVYQMSFNDGGVAKSIWYHNDLSWVVLDVAFVQ